MPVGVNVTHTLQCVPGCTPFAHVFLGIPKLPEIAMLDTVISASPVFLSATSCVGLVWPTSTCPKLRLDGETTPKGPLCEGADLLSKNAATKKRVAKVMARLIILILA